MEKSMLIRHKGQLIGLLCFLFVGIIAENDKKIEPQDTKQVMNTVLFVQQQKGIQDAVHTLAKVMEDGKLAVEFKTVDEAVKTITDLANFRKLDVDYYGMFKSAVEKGLKQKGLTLSYAQLCDDKTTRAPRPTPQTALDVPEAAPGVDQIIYAAVNETMKRLSQSGSLALRWLTVKDGGLFWGPVTFKDMVHMEDDLHVLGSVEIDHDLTVHRNTLLGDQDADTIGIHGITTINTTGAATTTIGNVTNGGVVTVDSATGANKINIGYTAGANPNINVGTAAISTAVTQDIAVGTSGFSGTAAETLNINIGNGTVAGSAAAKTLAVNIASGANSATVGSSQAVAIASGVISGVPASGEQDITVTIANGAVSAAAIDADFDVNIASGNNESTTACTKDVTIANGTISGNAAHTQTVSVASGDITPATAVTNTVSIASGALSGAAHVNLINIGNGAVTGATAANRDVNIASGTNASTGANSLDINIGSGANTGTGAGVCTQTIKIGSADLGNDGAAGAAHVYKVDIATGAVKGTTAVVTNEVNIATGGLEDAAHVQTITIGSGTIANSTTTNGKTVNIATGTNTVLGAGYTRIVNIGTAQGAANDDTVINLNSRRSNAVEHSEVVGVIPTGLRIVRGTIGSTGTIEAGTGTFTVVSGGLGLYTITFSPVFAAAPSVVATPETIGYSASNTTAPTASTAIITTANIAGTGTDNRFCFIAIGPMATA